MGLKQQGDLPLVTFILVAYQQESYVREAVEAAFAQDYPRLQIILSDDCSADTTYAIMRDMREAYRGPHEILLNRTATNVGLTAHLNDVIGRADGELIVFAAGDDISSPERTTKLVDAWLKSGRTAQLLHSDARRISADGRILGIRQPEEPARTTPTPEALAAAGTGVIGATVAVTPQLFDRFGPLDPELGCEDLVMPFWAALVDGLLYVREPLVAHREVGISSAFEPETGSELLYGSWLKYHRWWRDSFRGRLAAAERQFGEPPTRLAELCRRGMARSSWPLRLAATPYPKRWPLLLPMFRDPHLPARAALKLSIMYLFPIAYAAQYDLKRSRRKRDG